MHTENKFKHWLKVKLCSTLSNSRFNNC